MKLKEVCNEIIFANSCFFDAVYYPTTVEELYGDLVFKNKNEEYNRDKNYTSSLSYVEPRKIPLTGQEELAGQHFLFSFSQHNFKVLLYAFDDIDPVEAFILGKGGILNPFITSLIPVINNKAIRYTIRYMSPETHEWKTLNLSEFKRLKNISSDKMYQKKIVWLPITS